tara:strand:+ start:781 stop:891 length:111 start_codon:yes stop_codon:yes gene_type:complete
MINAANASNPNKKVSSMALPAQGAPNGQGLDAQAQL